MAESKKIIVGNWKMNPGTLSEAKKISRKVKRAMTEPGRVKVIICPPFPFIAGCVPKNPVADFHVGAQSVSREGDPGPYTGEVSAAMLRDIGAEYAIVGHSEERKIGNTDAIVARQTMAALVAGLIPIVCVGETARDDSGGYLDGLKGQIKGSLSDIPKKFAKDIMLAYEPVWAIGAKEAMQPEQIYETSLFVRKVFADIFGSDNGLKVTVLYGGAVNFRNTSDIIKTGKVDGLLVGRESVNTPGFIELIRAVNSIV